LSTPITRDLILHNLYLNAQVDEAIAKLNQPELHEDLKQELFTVICGWPEDVLIEKYNQNYLLWSVLRTIRNMYKSSSSKFHKEYRAKMDDLPGVNAIAVYTGDHSEGDLFTMGIYQTHKPLSEPEDAPDNILEKVEPAIASLNASNWYQGGVFKIYVDSGRNHAAVVRKTGIPETSIRLAVKAAKSTLKSLIRS